MNPAGAAPWESYPAWERRPPNGENPIKPGPPHNPFFFVVASVFKCKSAMGDAALAKLKRKFEELAAFAAEGQAMVDDLTAEVARAKKRARCASSARKPLSCFASYPAQFLPRRSQFSRQEALAETAESMAGLLQSIRNGTSPDPEDRAGLGSPRPAEGAAGAGPAAESNVVIVNPSPVGQPMGLEKLWRVVFVGDDCDGGHLSCTRPKVHRGHHNGTCVPGTSCTTIYPHNPREPHEWLSLHITVGVAPAVIASPTEIARRPVAGLPLSGQAFLRQVAEFIYGDGAPMSRLWLASLASADRVGPRKRIVAALNGCFTRQGFTPAAALVALAANCGKLAWPPRGYGG